MTQDLQHPSGPSVKEPGDLRVSQVDTRVLAAEPPLKYINLLKKIILYKPKIEVWAHLKLRTHWKALLRLTLRCVLSLSTLLYHIPPGSPPTSTSWPFCTQQKREEKHLSAANPSSIPAQHNTGQGDKPSLEDAQALIWSFMVHERIGGEEQAPASPGTSPSLQRTGR